MARQNLRKATEAVDQMLRRVADEYLLRQPRMTGIRRALLEDAARFYQKFVEQQGEEPWLRLEASRAYLSLTDVLNELGDSNRALETARKAVALLEQLHREEPPVQTRGSAAVRASVHPLDSPSADGSGKQRHGWELVFAYLHLGQTLRERGQTDDAENVLRKAIELCGRLAASAPDDRRARLQLADCQAELSTVLQSAHRRREAEKACRQALALAEKFIAIYPADRQAPALVGRCQTVLGGILFSNGQRGEAETLVRAALRTQQQAGPDMFKDPTRYAGMAETFAILADILRRRGRAAEAQHAARQALFLTDKLVEDFPAVLWYRQMQSGCLITTLKTLGWQAEADRLYLRAVASLERLSTQWPDVPGYREDLAALYLLRGKALHWSVLQQAEQAYRKALPLAEKLATEDPQMPRYQKLVVECRTQLAYVLVNGNRSAEAAAICVPAIPLARKIVAAVPGQPDYQWLLAHTYLVFGLALKGIHKTAEAEKAVHQGMGVSEKLAQQFPHSAAYRLQEIAVQRELGSLWAEDPSRVRDTEAAHRRELELLQKAVADFPTDPLFSGHLAHCHRLWAFFMQDRGRLSEAQDEFRQAALVLEKWLACASGAAPNQRALLGDTYLCLGSLLASVGKRKEAKAAMDKANAFPPEDAADYNHRAWVLATCPDPDVGKDARAVEWAKKAVELAPRDGNYWNTLGVAYCRRADWKRAIEALTKSNALVGPGRASLRNGFLLAIAHTRLGQSEKASQSFRQANAWMDKHARHNPELLRFRAQAEAIVEKTKTEVMKK